jgi:hypothetical protein
LHWDPKLIRNDNNRFEAAEVINKSKAEKAEKKYEVLLNKYRQLDFEFEQVSVIKLFFFVTDNRAI